MIEDQDECLRQVQNFADSPEIVQDLRILMLTDGMPPLDVSALSRAIEHIEGQYRLIRSMRYHLAKKMLDG